MDGNNGTGHGRVVAALDGVGMHRHTAGQVTLGSVDWTVRAGEHWALLGPNGAGKTSVLRLVGATAFPTAGTVDVLGHRLGRVDVRELRARIGHVSTSQRVPGDLTGHTTVLTSHTGTVQPPWKSYDDEVRERARTLLAELRIKDLADRPYGVCPGGQRARILIARALMADPALLLLEGRVLAAGAVEDVLTQERMTACFGRPIEVSRHAGRWLARSGGFG